MLLAIDTSTHYASVAVHDGSRLVAENTWLANHDHTRMLLPAIQHLLTESGATIDGLSGLAVALGPGSFNGLRVGLSTAKALVIAAGLPLVGVPTLELLATEYGLTEATMNAGRGRVYRWTRSSSSHEVELVEGVAPDRVRHAGVLAELGWQRLRAGQTLDAAVVKPIYARPPDITPSRKKAHMAPDPQPHPRPEGEETSTAA